MSEKVLEINGLNCGYGSVQILYDIDLYVDKGEFVTIIGPNGCGKSTLIKTIFGIATHYSGTVQHEGEEGLENRPVSQPRYCLRPSGQQCIPIFDCS